MSVLSNMVKFTSIPAKQEVSTIPADQLPDNKGAAINMLNGVYSTPRLQGVSRQKMDANLLRRQEVQELWLQGWTPAEIALKLEVAIPTISGDIRRFRGELYENNTATLAEHTEQSVAIARRLNTELYAELDDASLPYKLKVLEQIRKNEEFIAKIRGLVQNNVKIERIVNIKMYKNFDTDDFPEAAALSSPQQLEAGSEAIEAVYKAVDSRDVGTDVDTEKELAVASDPSGSISADDAQPKADYELVSEVAAARVPAGIGRPDFHTDSPVIETPKGNLIAKDTRGIK